METTINANILVNSTNNPNFAVHYYIKSKRSSLCCGNQKYLNNGPFQSCLSQAFAICLQRIGLLRNSPI